MKTTLLARRVFPVSKRGIFKTSTTCLVCLSEFRIERQQLVVELRVEDETIGYVCETCLPPTKKAAAPRSRHGDGDEAMA